MATKKSPQSLAQIFRLLGDPSRLKIVMALGGGEQNVTQLCRQLRMSQPTVSRHLSILKMSRLAESRRSGKEIFYSLPSNNRRTVKSLLERAATLAQRRSR